MLVVAVAMRMTKEVNKVAFQGVVVVFVLVVVNVHWAYLDCFLPGKTVSVVVRETKERVLGIGVGYKIPSPIPATVNETAISHNYYLSSLFSSFLTQIHPQPAP